MSGTKPSRVKWDSYNGFVMTRKVSGSPHGRSRAPQWFALSARQGIATKPPGTGRGGPADARRDTAAPESPAAPPASHSPPDLLSFCSGIGCERRIGGCRPADHGRAGVVTCGYVAQDAVACGQLPEGLSAGISAWSRAGLSMGRCLLSWCRDGDQRQGRCVCGPGEVDSAPLGSGGAEGGEGAACR